MEEPGTSSKRLRHERRITQAARWRTALAVFVAGILASCLLLGTCADRHLRRSAWYAPRLRMIDAPPVIATMCPDAQSTAPEWQEKGTCCTARTDRLGPSRPTYSFRWLGRDLLPSTKSWLCCRSLVTGVPSRPEALPGNITDSAGGTLPQVFAAKQRMAAVFGKVLSASASRLSTQQLQPVNPALQPQQILAEHARSAPGTHSSSSATASAATVHYKPLQHQANRAEYSGVVDAGAVRLLDNAYGAAQTLRRTHRPRTRLAASNSASHISPGQEIARLQSRDSASHAHIASLAAMQGSGGPTLAAVALKPARRLLSSPVEPAPEFTSGANGSLHTSSSTSSAATQWPWFDSSSSSLDVSGLDSAKHEHAVAATTATPSAQWQGLNTRSSRSMGAAALDSEGHVRKLALRGQKGRRVARSTPRMDWMPTPAWASTPSVVHIPSTPHSLFTWAGRTFGSPPTAASEQEEFERSARDARAAASGSTGV